LQDCGFSAFLETFVLNQSLGIFRNFSAKSTQPRKARGRCEPFTTTMCKKEYFKKLEIF
jgi:hypothetical protein